MKRSLLVAMTVALGLFAFATQAPAGCGWFGTQFECDLGKAQVSLGTQRNSEPACAGVSTLQPVAGCDGLLADRGDPATPFRIELQNVGIDPSLCQRLGNETYCY